MLSINRLLTPKQLDVLSKRITAHPKGALPNSDITPKLRCYIYQRDEGLCVYCKSDTYLQCDHVIPISHGGPGIKENTVLACQSCNSLKTNSFRIDFLTVAFNHLLYVGESIDWMDKIFTTEDEDEELKADKESECLMCQEEMCYHENLDFCSISCENDFYYEFEED